MRKVFVILVSSTIFAVMFWIVVMLGAALAEESYFPVLNPIHIQAGKNLQPGLMSTGNIDATTSTVTAATVLTGTANAQNVNVSGTLSMTGSAANIALGNNYLSGDGGDEGIFVDSNGNVSVGSNTLPLTSRLNVAGYITTSTSTPGHAINQLLSVNPDLNALFFGGYYHDYVAYKASSKLGTFALYKSNNELQVTYADAVNIGDVISYPLVVAQKWDASNGTTTITPGGAAVLTIQSASYELTGAVGNSAAIFDSVAIRSGVFQEGLKAPYKKDIETLDGNPVDLITTDEVPTIYRYKINPEWAEEKAEKIYQAELKEYQKRKEGQEPVKRVEPVHEGWQEGFIREKLPERYHTPDGGINLSLIAQDALARVAALEKRVEALEERR